MSKDKGDLAEASETYGAKGLILAKDKDGTRIVVVKAKNLT